ncbi:MAG: hypothetical protein M1834_003226 [Cirrosporium novae-zelandiae]|nr:MAG: hypothetical protein M1834_003226 [Cirrosporium novae-zelandiae]
MHFSINPVRSTEDLEATKCLFKAYAEHLNIDLTFQDFGNEMNSMPGKYAPPNGELLLARDASGVPLGCVAVRPLASQSCCEMKRLFISPTGRGKGLGKELVKAVVETASGLGYTEMRLDTIPSMVQAISIYEKAGFVPIKAYYNTPLEGTIFLSRKLVSTDAAPAAPLDGSS